MPGVYKLGSSVTIHRIVNVNRLCMQLIFTAPVIVASSVENMWLYTHKSHLKPHLTDALWLGCGAAGMKVGDIFIAAFICCTEI